MATFKPVDVRTDAARYLSEAVTGVKAQQLLADDLLGELVTATFERAITGHRTCGCERAVRLERARDILLGVPPAVPGELRLL